MNYRELAQTMVDAWDFSQLTTYDQAVTAAVTAQVVLILCDQIPEGQGRDLPDFIDAIEAMT